jgi:hypothetical protein
MPMNAARPLRDQRGYVIFVVAAVLALFQPLFTPLMPELAGWLPGHQHVSVNGVPVDHAHPWDDTTGGDAPATGEAPAGFIFHLCDIHPDGWVPVGSTSSPGATEASGSPADAAESEAGEVVFTFDLGVSAVALPGLGADLAPCSGELVLSPARAASPVTAPGEHPLPPPPRA